MNKKILVILIMFLLAARIIEVAVRKYYFTRENADIPVVRIRSNSKVLPPVVFMDRLSGDVPLVSWTRSGLEYFVPIQNSSDFIALGELGTVWLVQYQGPSLRATATLLAHMSRGYFASCHVFYPGDRLLEYLQVQQGHVILFPALMTISSQTGQATIFAPGFQYTMEHPLIDSSAPFQ